MDKGEYFMAGKRRQGKWSKAFRQRIVAEAEASDGPMSEVARRRGVNPKLLYNWRQQFASVVAQTATGKEVCLVPVEVEAAPIVPPESSNTSGAVCLEVTFPCGAQVRCGNGTEPALLSAALSELKPRAPGTAP